MPAAAPSDEGEAPDLELQLAKPCDIDCDCDKILGTVYELKNLLTEQECAVLTVAACKTAAQIGWGANEHANAATQDVKIWQMKSALATEIFKEKLVEPMREVIAEKYDLPLEKVQVDDGFVVRYAMTAQKNLKLHRDGSIVSAIVSLSSKDEYKGGGTVFANGSYYVPERGSGILFGGQRLHGGLDITDGERFICTLFFQCADLTCRNRAVILDRGEGDVVEVDGGGDIMSQIGNLFGFGGK